MRGIILLLLIAAAVGFRFLPWQYKLVAAGVIVLALFLFGGKILHWLFTLPFKAKGKVLHKAELEVHSVKPGKTPEPDEEGDEDELRSQRRYFALDATIKPQPNASTPFQHWELGELALVADGEDLMHGKGEPDSCRIYKSRFVDLPDRKKTENEEGEEDDAGDKVGGPHRVKFLIGVKPGVSKLRFQYYFEKFGEVNLPR